MSDNPLRVSLENIIPLTEARDHFSQIVNEVQKDKLYVLTKGGKPAVAIIDVKYLEQITGGNVNPNQVETEIQKNPAKVGRVEMVSHTKKPTTLSTPVPMPTPMPTPIPTPPKLNTPPPPPPMPAPKPPTPTFTTPTTTTTATTTTTTPTPPKPIPTPVPPIATPIPPTITPTAITPAPAPTLKPSSLPPNSTPPPPKPTPVPAAPGLITPIETSFSGNQSIAPIKPGDNPKPATMIDMHTMDDIDDQEKTKDSATQSDNDRTETDDKPNPAQYSATSANTEPDDMMID